MLILDRNWRPPGIDMCGSCGKALGKSSASVAGGTVPVYRCLGRVRRECGNPVSVRAATLDGFVADYFSGLREMPVSDQRMEVDEDDVARKAAYATEIARLTQSMVRLPVDEIPAAAERLTTLRTEMDAIQPQMRLVTVPTGKTVQELWDEDPRRIITTWIDGVVVNPGRGTGRIDIVVEGIRHRDIPELDTL